MADIKSNWAHYLSEREGKSVLEWPHSFVVWHFREEWLYVVDVWVDSAHRQSHIASSMLNQLAELALQSGYNKLLTSADLRDPGCAVSMKAILKYGFKPLHADGQFIYFEKYLKPIMANGAK